MKVTNNKLAEAVKFGLVAGFTTIAFAGVASAQTTTTSDEDNNQTTESTTTAKSVGKVTVTGSRLKRADVEGATPVTIMTKTDLDQTGKTSVADVLRDVPAASAGNYRPQSGSSAATLATVDLGGLGSDRTLVLIDGRRLPKAPFADSSNDLNSIPSGAIERIEILTDGASAVYGSDAIGGVVNVITRKDFNGAELRYGIGQTKVKGGDTAEWAATFGASGERGRLVAGVNGSERGMVFTRDQIGYEQGLSSYGNNYRTPAGYKAVPGFACDTNGFWMTSGGSCSFDFNSVAANEMSIKQKGIFLRGEYNINDNWSTYINGTVNNTKGFGRYAPVPGQFTVADGTPNDVIKDDGLPTTLRHRLAAFGNRDDFTNATMYDGLVGFKGRVWDKVDLDFGVRRSNYEFDKRGTGYTVNPLVVAAMESGDYLVADPFNPNQPGVTTTISRDSFFKVDELFAVSNFDVFEMAGGTSNAVVGVEYRKEDYADIYDLLSEAGVVDGSAGNSSGGDRTVGSAFFEWLFPIAKSLDITVAGRYDKYSDYGADFSPKVAFRYQPFSRLTLRGSYGEGFRAPELSIITQKDSFSADFVVDVPTCVAFGGAPADCADSEIQVDTFYVANPSIASEQSKQWALGFAADPTDWFNLTMDYRNIEIQDRIRSFSAQDLIDREQNPELGAIPAGLGLVRNPTSGAIEVVTAGFGNEGTLNAEYLDAAFRTRFALGSGTLRNQLNVSHLVKYTIDDGADLSGIVGLPSTRATLTNTYNVGDWTFGTSHNFIDGQEDSDGTTVGSYTLNNIFTTYNTPWNATVQVGVNNIGDRYPELVGYGGRPWNFNLYDAYGRTVYFRYTQRF